MAPDPRADATARLLGPAGEREAAALAAVVELAGQAGFDASGAGIWRSSSSVMVGLPAAGVLGRVDAPARADAAGRQVAVAEVLASRGVPCISLAGRGGQPVASHAGAVTFWVWLDALDRDVTPTELGGLARSLHDETRGGVAGVPAFDPLVAVADELDRARTSTRTGDDDLGLLGDHLARLRDRWPEVAEDPFGVAVVHGDLHKHNAVPTTTGPVLADLELAGVGPVSADLVPQVVAVRRYGAPPRTLHDLFGGYGAEPPRWPGLEVLVEAHELWVTVWTVANRGTGPALDAEAEVRLDRWRPGRRSARPWLLH